MLVYVISFVIIDFSAGCGLQRKLGIVSHKNMRSIHQQLQFFAERLFSIFGKSCNARNRIGYHSQSLFVG